MLSKRGDTNGDLYHVRKNHDFFYEDPVLRRPVESNTSYGRSEITHLSRRGKDSAAQILDSHGKNKNNLPRGDTNCQDWTGTRDYWKENVGQSSEDIGNRLQRDGRSWIPKPTEEPSRRGPADATFGREQIRQPTGRLNMDKFAGLSGLSGGSGKSRR
ncbi:uncharacterized protein TRUGW13939_03269 [Talaromyces rugulosus]|uniref:Uncharacterized protein n=1 Tax=Talaromyces rugulosus TaxID=121627 RepID=A0A7H8QQN0_TALRU|nr:uncharacterized protein TRUGW13939_03269 [Talaromyces rugulosus]QKX56169.1 hypothetical protein TRUGW13939_03269 [Talaromyces rugulosus]